MSHGSHPSNKRKNKLVLASRFPPAHGLVAAPRGAEGAKGRGKGTAAWLLGHLDHPSPGEKKVLGETSVHEVSLEVR